MNRWDAPSQRLRPLVRLGLVGILLANLAFTSLSTFLSMHNYPGGEVRKALEEIQASSNDSRTFPLLLV
jgi:alpha-1,6-mannosyltransferase